MSRSDERGVTDVIGFILVFGLVATTVAIISVNGLSTLRDTRDAEQINNAERAFDVLDDNMADIYQEGAPHRATEISLQEARLNTATVVKINISGVQKSSGDLEAISDVPVQPIVWESAKGRETNIVYSFGAVVRASQEGGVVLNEPPFVLERDKMILMIVKTRTNTPESLSGTTVRVRGSQALTAGEDFNTELNDYSALKVNVTSPRAQVWKRYFEQKDITVDDSCSIDEETGSKRVSCELAVPEELYVSVNGVEVDIEG